MLAERKSAACEALRPFLGLCWYLSPWPGDLDCDLACRASRLCRCSLSRFTAELSESLGTSRVSWGVSPESSFKSELNESFKNLYLYYHHCSASHRVQVQPQVRGDIHLLLRTPGDRGVPPTLGVHSLGTNIVHFTNESDHNNSRWFDFNYSVTFF